ncbi:MAG: archaeosortase/exosortase family protein, partial [Pseudomonadota bacterium]
MSDIGGEATTQSGWMPVAKRAWKGAALLLLACAVAAVMFYEGIEGLWLGWQAPEYSHGPLIPLISGYLFLRQMKQSPPHIGPVDDRWPGVAVLLLALAIALFGSIVQIQKIVALGIIIWVGGMILVSFGWKRGKQFWPPVLHLVFMMPLPYFFYWKTSLALQHVSSEIGVEFIR